MENFNQIRNKFEQGFSSLEGSTAVDLSAPEYINIVENTKEKPLKQLRSRPPKQLSLPNHEYVNIEYGNQKLIEPAHLTRSTRKKNPKKLRAKRLEILPSIHENFSKLDLSDHEYENIQAEALASTEFFLSENISSKNSLKQNEWLPYQNSAEDYAEYAIDNTLYVDFLQRIGESSTDFFPAAADKSISQKILNENEPFSSTKQNLFINFSETKKSTIDSASNLLTSKKKSKKNQAKTLLLEEENEEPIFGNITKRNPDGTIEWESWQPPSLQSESIKSKQPRLKLSKFLPEKICFWHTPETKEDLEEKNSKTMQLKK
ncbi:MAG: hypothetical protein WA659_04420 [Candidatus Aquirickettsiella sp.]